MADFINQIRFCHFISGVLYNQQSDPLCCNCKAFVNTVKKMRDALSELNSICVKNAGDIPAETFHILEEAQARTDLITISEDAVGQKKAGKCRMPEGVCFVKISKSILEKLQT